MYYTPQYSFSHSHTTYYSLFVRLVRDFLSCLKRFKGRRHKMLDEVFEREPKKKKTHDSKKEEGGNPRAKPRITHTKTHNSQLFFWMHISCNLIVKYKIYVCVVQSC